MGQLIIAGRPVPTARAQYDDVASTLAYAASATPSINLPVDGLVTSVRLMADPLNYDASGGSISPNDDAAMRAFNGVRITADGGTTRFAYTDARGKYYDDRYLLGNAGAVGNINTGSSTGYSFRHTLHHHCGVKPGRPDSGGRMFDPFDASGGYDASALKNHVLTWTTPANTVMGTHAVIQTTSVLKARIARWTNVPAGLAAMVPIPSFVETLWTIDTTYSDLKKTFDLPTSCWIRRTVIIVTDNGAAPADVRDDTRVTQLGILVNKPQATRPTNLTWREWRSDTIAAAGWVVDNGTAAANVATADMPYAGVVVIDWARETGYLYGLGQTNMDNSPRLASDVQLGLSIGTGNGTVKIYHQTYVNVGAWYAQQRTA